MMGQFCLPIFTHEILFLIFILSLVGIVIKGVTVPKENKFSMFF